MSTTNKGVSAKANGDGERAGAVQEPEFMSVLTAAFSGMTGGGIVGSFLGVPGVIGGGLVGAIISGLAEHVHSKKQELTSDQ